MSAKRRGTQIFIIVIVAAFVLSSIGFSGLVIWDMTRKKDDPADIQKQLQEQLAQQNQSQENKLQGTKLENFEPIAKVEKLQSIDVKEGTGETVPKGATVTAHYTGALARDGTIFQSSRDMGQPVPFSLSGVIKGWTEGVPGMKVGGIRRLIIPAELAYGAQSPSPDIPPNSDLVFDIEVVKLGE